MARPSKYNWEDIEKHYRAGYSQKQITEQFGCPKSSLSEKVKKEGWVVSELAEHLNKGIVEVSELKSSLIKEDVRLCEIVEDKANEEARRKKLVTNASEAILKRVQDLADTNKKQVVMKVKEYSKDNGSSESLDMIEVALDTTDLKNMAETADKVGMTIGVVQRHANQNINVNTQNNQVQHTELNQQTVQQTLEAFDNEY